MVDCVYFHFARMVSIFVLLLQYCQSSHLFLAVVVANVVLLLLVLIVLRRLVIFLVLVLLQVMIFIPFYFHSLDNNAPPVFRVQTNNGHMPDAQNYHDRLQQKAHWRQSETYIH
jgi:hypothetical protein